MRRLAAAAAACAAVLLTGCTATPPASDKSGSGVLPERITEAGKLVVGIEASYPPMAFEDPSNQRRTGFNVDLVNAVADELDVRVEWQEMSFEQLMSSASTRRIDMVGAAMSDLPERRGKLDFVDYLKTGPRFFTVKGGKLEKAKPDDLCGKKVGAPRSTSYPSEVDAWSKDNCQAKGSPAIRTVGTSGAAATRTDLKQERLDAAVLGAEFLVHLQAQEKGTYVPIGGTFAEQLFGFGFATDEDRLQKAVAQALEKLLSSGEYTKIVKKWGLTDQAVTDIKINAG